MAKFNKNTKQNSEFDQRVIDVRRVARVTSGGRRFSFRVTVAIGDKKGKVGVGTDKAQDVSSAVGKAVQKAKKNMVKVNFNDKTIPHEVDFKYKGARVMLKPAKLGRGVIAGGAVRVICDLAGIRNITGKIMSRSSNKLNNSVATIEALRRLKPARQRKNKPAAVSEEKKKQPVVEETSSNKSETQSPKSKIQ
jgi:small subunit ribosomal protein S5